MSIPALSATDHPICPICLSEVTVPVKLECGHIVDFSCIGRWVNTHPSTCPLDRSAISVVSLVDVEPARAITFRFPRIELIFHANIRTPVNALAEIYAVCKDPSLSGYLTPILSKIPGLSPPSDEASAFAGTVRVSKIEGIDLQEESPRLGYYHGNFSSSCTTTLETIGIVAGVQLKIIPHIILHWNPT